MQELQQQQPGALSVTAADKYDPARAIQGLRRMAAGLSCYLTLFYVFFCDAFGRFWAQMDVPKTNGRYWTRVDLQNAQKRPKTSKNVHKQTSKNAHFRPIRSTCCVLSSPFPASISVHFRPFPSISNHFRTLARPLASTSVQNVHLRPFASICVHLRPFASTCVHVTPFASILLHFTPFYSTLRHLPPLSSIISHFIPLASICVQLIPFESSLFHLRRLFPSIFVHFLRPFWSTCLASYFVR